MYLVRQAWVYSCMYIDKYTTHVWMHACMYVYVYMLYKCLHLGMNIVGRNPYVHACVHI